METKVNVYQKVTDRIIEQLEKGIVPWQRPWSCDSKTIAVFGGAINYVTRKPYSMLNQMLLGRNGEYLTFKQIKSLGGSVKKGAKAGMVVFYSPYQVKDTKTDEQGNEVEVIKNIPLLKYYHVFHIEDTTGIESKLPAVTTEEVKNENQPIEKAEQIVNGYVARETALKFYNNAPSNRAFYSPATDSVTVPMINQYKVVEEYYSTTFHELTHSTMKSTRCDRKESQGIAAFGSDKYSREELVAELGAAMLCSVAELDNEKAFNNSVAYISSWLKALKNDNKMIVWAASRAEKAAKYIIGGTDK